jgi:regulator of sirC expression with transglutaminase-like and TPR domain
MTSRTKITKVLLNDKTDEEYILFGIVSSEADYKLSQMLNKKLKLALKNSKSLDIAENDGEKMIFSRYSYISASPEINYNLISNRSGKDYLLKKLKKIDFFFQFHKNENYCDTEQITNALREIEKITAVFRLDPKEIKDKNLAYLIP